MDSAMARRQPSLALFWLQNAGAEPAMEWVLSHMGDDDFNEPLEAPAATAAPAGPAPDKDSLVMLSSMGFTETQAAAALKVGG